MKEMYVIPRYTLWAMDGSIKTKEALLTVYRQRKRDLSGPTPGKGGFRGSLIGHPCDRLQALSFVGAKNHDDRDKRFAEAGRQRHYEWQEIGLSAGFLVEIEKKVKLGRFRGTVDGILDNGWVFELKTTNDYSFRPTRARREQGALGTSDRANDDHFVQVQMYMHALGAPKAVLLYEARNSLDLAEHIIEYVPWIAEREMRRIAEIEWTVKKKDELPAMHKACTDTSKMRENCNFAEECLRRRAKELVHPDA